MKKKHLQFITNKLHIMTLDFTSCEMSSDATLICERYNGADYDTDLLTAVMTIAIDMTKSERKVLRKHPEKFANEIIYEMYFINTSSDKRRHGYNLPDDCVFTLS